MPQVIFPGSGGGGGGVVNLTIQEEGVNVQTEVNTINFVGSDVQAQAGGANTAIIYIPTPTFASHFNSQDGTTDTRVRNSGATFFQRFISSPTAEGNPFYTGGWAGTVQQATNSDGITLNSNGQFVTAMNNSTFTVEVNNPDGTNLQTYTTPAITTSDTFDSGEAGSPHISVTISNYQLDSATKFKGIVSIIVRYPLILTANGLDGGRVNIIITQNVTDGTGPWVFNMSTNGAFSPGEFFYDSQSGTVRAATGITMTQNVGALFVKHLSGIEYYTTGSQFTFAVNDIDNYNLNTVLEPNADPNSTVIVDNSTYGFTDLDQSPLPTGAGAVNFSGWNSNYNTQNISYSNGSITINRTDHRFFGNNGSAGIRLYRWFGANNIYNSPIESILVDTFGTTSDDLLDEFDDEARRLEGDYTTAWVSANTLGTASTATCQIELTGNLVNGDDVQLTDFTGSNRIFVAGTDFAVGATIADTASNLAVAINGNVNFGSASVSPYVGFEQIVTVVQSSAGPSGNRTNNAPTGNVTVTDFTDGSNDALVMRSYIQDASRATYSNGVTLNPDWSSFKPDSGGANPDYTALSGPASYYRTIVDASGLSRSSFTVTFTGTYNNGNITNFTQYLSNESLKFFIRKVNSSNAQGITGKTIPPMRLHGGTFGGGFDQGKTILGSYCRITTAATNAIQGTFGGFGCVDGFYLEIQITDPLLKLDQIVVVFT